MITRYDRMRAAATEIEHMLDFGESHNKAMRLAMANNLRADADRLEALEKEMRNPYAQPTMGVLKHCADTMRGEAKT